jgi:hypothetical protein
LQDLNPTQVWHVTANEKVMYIFTLDYSKLCLCIATSFVVHDDMSVKLFCNDKECTKELRSILGSDLVLRRWTQFENFLSRYRNRIAAVEVQCDEVKCVNDVCETLEALCAKPDALKVSVGSLAFNAEQLRLLLMPGNRRRYSSDMLKFAFLLFARSPACYRIMYNQSTLILPHPRTLSKLAAAVSVSPGVSNTEQNKYLQNCSSQ